MLHSPRILVLGLGRIDRGDAGIGLHLARSLRAALDGVDVEEAPEDASYVDIFESYDVMIVLDAICLSSEVGRVLVVSPYSLEDLREAGDSQLEKLGEAMEAARVHGHRLPRIEIVGVCLGDPGGRNAAAKGELSKEIRGKYDVILARVKGVVTDLIRNARSASPLASGR